ncbi:MAG: hypothetical protein ABFD69_15945 [Candidatus Sumerlaeia bacterium]
MNTRRSVLSILFVVFSIILALPATAASKIGYPCTMYKPAEIARAKENIARHEWAKKEYAAIKKSANYLLKLDRDQIRAFISDKTPISHFKCPKDGQYFLFPPAYADLIGENLDTLRCKNCGTEFKLDESAPEGENVNSVIRSRRLIYIVAGVDAAGIVYQIEGDKRYAEKAAAVIERFAEVYKGYKNTNSTSQVFRLRPPHPYYSRINGWSYFDGQTNKKMLQAYDLIHESGALSKDQCAKIDRDLVENMRDFYLAGYQNTTDPLGRKGPLFATYQIQDQGHKWWALTAAGALLGDDATLKLMVNTFEEMFDPANGVIFEDGTFYQGSADYQKQSFVNWVGVPEIIRGNLDADIYSNPKCRLLQKSWTWQLDEIFPNDTLPAVNDSHVGSTCPENYAELAWTVYRDPKALAYLKKRWGAGLEKGDRYSLFFRDPNMDVSAATEPYGVTSAHLTGAGLMILRDDRATTADRTMAFIDYGQYKPEVFPPAHKHRDYLNLDLWACGMEMISEMGYIHDPKYYLKYQQGPLSHNSIREVAEQPDKGEALLWSITPAARLAEAGQPGKNARFIALVPREEGEPILVDVFRAWGDDTITTFTGFTWQLHARSNELQLEGVGKMTATQAIKPLSDAVQGTATGDLVATWTFPGKRPCGLLAIQTGAKGATVIRSTSPAEEDQIKPLDYVETTQSPKPGKTVPVRAHLQVKRPEAAPVFTTIYLPYEGTEAPKINVKRLNVKSADKEAVALSIEVGGERYVVVHSPAAGKAAAGKLELDGRAAIACWRGEELAWATLAGGRTLKAGSKTVKADAEGNGWSR